MIVLIGDHNPIQLAIIRHAGGPIELTRARPIRAELAHELALPIENLHAVIGPVRNNNTAAIVAAHTPRATELPVPIALAPPIDAELELAHTPIAAPTLRLHTVRTARHMVAVDKHRDHVLSVRRWTVADRVGAVLLVDNVNAVELFVGTFVIIKVMLLINHYNKNKWVLIICVLDFS